MGLAQQNAVRDFLRRAGTSLKKSASVQFTAERAADLYPYEAHSFQAVIEIITRYVVARALKKARFVSFFPSFTAAAAHALARRAVRPVSHTPSQSCQAPKGVRRREARKAAHSNPKKNM